MLTLTSDQIITLCDALPRAADLANAMALIEPVRLALVGRGLLTINLRSGGHPGPGLADLEAIALERIWTSDPVAYPVAGRKLKPMTAWTRRLFVDAQVFIGEGAAALTEVFDDHRRILSLGLSAVINVPLIDDDGRCFATFNSLVPAPRWRDEQRDAVQLLARLVTPAVARHARIRSTPSLVS